MKMAPQCDNRGDHVERIEPGTEARNLFLNNRAGLLCLLLPLLKVGAHNGLEVIDIVQENVVEFTHLRVYIPRNGDIDQEHLIIPPLLHCAGDFVPVEYVAWRACRADHHIRPVEVGQSILPGEGLPVHTVGELLRSREGPACDQQALDTGVHQVQRRQLAHFACAQHQGRGARQITEYLLGQLHCRKTHRNGPRPDLRFGSGPFGGLHGRAEKPVEHGATAFSSHRGSARVLHLTGYLGLPHNHRVQPRGDAEEVPNRLFILIDEEVCVNSFRLQITPPAQSRHDARLRRGLGIRQEIDLGPVAGGYEDRLGHPLDVAKGLEGRVDILGGDGNGVPQVDRRIVVTQTYGENGHLLVISSARNQLQLQVRPTNRPSCCGYRSASRDSGRPLNGANARRRAGQDS